MGKAVRPAAFAGSWYPARAADCARDIHRFLAGAEPPETQREATLVGGIVPHAGWAYSGALACRVIARLRRGADPVPEAIVLFGGHLPPSAPNVMMPAGAWETPFGEIPVAEELAAEIAPRFPFRLESPERGLPDNTIELQLPFLKHFYPEARLLAIAVPPTEATLVLAAEVVAAARRLGIPLQVLGSTDLTHYGPNYGRLDHGRGAEALAWVTGENDRRILEAMAALNPRRVIAEALAHENACCPGAAAAAIAAGLRLGARKAEVVGYTTSHERHPADSFVGYGGVVF